MNDRDVVIKVYAVFSFIAHVGAASSQLR